MKAYDHKGKKMSHPKDSVKVTPEMAKMAPQHKPSKKKSHPSAQYKEPKGGEQSMAPDHKKKSMTMEHAPKGVAAPNGGQSMKMPEGGGPGESKV